MEQIYRPGKTELVTILPIWLKNQTNDSKCCSDIFLDSITWWHTSNAMNLLTYADFGELKTAGLVFFTFQMTCIKTSKSKRSPISNNRKNVSVWISYQFQSLLHLFLSIQMKHNIATTYVEFYLVNIFVINAKTTTLLIERRLLNKWIYDFLFESRLWIKFWHFLCTVKNIIVFENLISKL